MEESDVKCKRKCLKKLSISTAFAVLLWFAYVFTPTTKELFAIYGIGGTIEYLKDNDTAKQLPDKALKAIDKYLESLSEDE